MSSLLYHHPSESLLLLFMVITKLFWILETCLAIVCWTQRLTAATAADLLLC